MTSHNDVLVVGAGPTGLALASALAAAGVDVRVIDKHPSPLEMTKAAALHARSLEYFRDLGVDDRILAEGRRVDVLTLRTGHRDRLTVDFRALADTAYPYMIDLPQNRTEHILIDRLAELGHAPDREVELLDATQDADHVSVTLRRADGSLEAATADWLVGADGADSTVRKLAGLEFQGEAYADAWALCDAIVDWPLPRNEMTFSADADGIYGVFPLPGDRHYRLAYTQSRTADGELVEPDLADAQRAMARTGIEGTIRSAGQFWTFDLAHRQAEHVRAGRVFLAGDAGHVHTPFGGQGLNLGIGDAVNLAWKLAAVVHGQAPASLLDSYEPERHRVGEEVVRFTHLGAQAMLARASTRGRVRDVVMTALQTVPGARRRLAHRFSQIEQTYRGTDAVTGRSAGLHAGDRLPDVAFFDGISQRPVRLHDLHQPGSHTLFVTDGGAELPAPQRLAATLLGRFAPQVDLVVLTTSWSRARALADAGVPVALDRGRQVGALHGRRSRSVLVRPDRHIGYVGSADGERLQAHLATVMTPAVTARTPSPATATPTPELTGSRR